MSCKRCLFYWYAYGRASPWRHFPLESRVNEMQSTGLERGQLSLCISLIENGVSPEAVVVCTSRRMIGMRTRLKSVGRY